MANFFSDQITKLDQTVPKQLVQANEFGGRMRIAYFTYKTPAAGMPTVADVIQLVRLPKGARVLEYYRNGEAMTTAGAAAGASIGTAASATAFVTTDNYDAAFNGFAVLNFDPTVPPVTGYGVELLAETTIIATVTGEQWAASKVIRGHFGYVLD
jgi:hypothetical protein